MARTEFFYSLGIRIFVSVYLSLVIIVGVIGNMFVCVVFGMAKELHTSINMLIVNLAVADILQSINMLFMIISVNYGKWILGNEMCQVNGFMTIAFIVTSLINLFLISVNRYIKICQPTRQDMFSKKVVYIVIAISWIFPWLIGIGPIFGWSKYLYRPGKLLCTIKFNYDYSFTITLMMCAVLIPFVGICYSYYKIVRTIRKSRSRIIKQTSTGYSQTRNRNENGIAIMLGTVIMSFMVFYLPSSAANFYEMSQGPNYDLPISFDLFGVLLAMLNHANNPIIYGLMNKNFRKPFLKLFCVDVSNNSDVMQQNKQVEETELQHNSGVIIGSPMMAHHPRELHE